MKKSVSKIIIISVASALAVILAIGAAGYFAFFKDISFHNLNYYQYARQNSGGRMPKTEEFEPYKDLRYSFYDDRFAFFQSFSHTISAYYDESEYAEKKEYFLSKSAIDSEFVYGDFEMIRLKNEEREREFPKLAYYYGFNDNAHQIVFVRFADQDLDGADDFEVLEICRFDDAVKER